ncbi:hypothetical protein ACFWYW_19755 [Nonomuraea sp. NPDC059023]|uniref:hypothetical protein n=1 Tax=Nonomuraea sp. NPDC059023 TaxID=3346706 RepID=UPI00369E7778
MLNDDQRRTRYFAQTGRSELTPRQRRRVRHKDNHQSALAVIARDEKTKAKVAAAEVRKRSALLPATSK